MHPLRLSLFAAALTLGAASCKPDLDQAPTASKGDADFSRYIAVGNSLTAGFGDNGLYLEGQLNSYPAIMAKQFAEAGGGAFEQPLFTEAQRNGTGYLRLDGFMADGSPILGSVTTQLAVRNLGAAIPLYTQFPGPINNLGVPGLRMADIKRRDVARPGADRFNALYERITTVANQRYLERVAASNPTFFTCWLGNNDVLGYATSGGAVAELSASSFGLTSDTVFVNRTNDLLNALTANGAKGVVGAIPDVTAIPFFNTVGPVVKAKLKTDNITQMVVTTGAFTFGPATLKTITVSDIKDATGGRQLFTLTASAYAPLIGQTTGKYWRDFKAQSGFDAIAALGLDTTKAFGLTAGNPWPSTLLLDDAEQVVVQAKTATFNNAMRVKAEAKGLAFFDAYTFFNEIAAKGLATNASANSTAYITGNLFSLDGVHPSPRGYAVIANEMIRVINAKYNSSVRGVNPNTYRGARYQ